MPRTGVFTAIQFGSTILWTEMCTSVYVGWMIYNVNASIYKWTETELNTVNEYSKEQFNNFWESENDGAKDSGVHTVLPALINVCVRE